jgi:sulfate permease, SulP family
MGRRRADLRYVRGTVHGRTSDGRMARANATVILSGLHRQPLEMLRRAGFINVIGRENLCAHFDAALVRAKVLLEQSDRH